MLTYPEPTFTLQGTPYLEYLPVVDVSTGRLLGMEALVRWRHPTRGRISPDLLIPAAEASGDIGPLTRWIVAAACEEACHWSRSIQLGVNCTVEQLQRARSRWRWPKPSNRPGFPSDQLNIEVTEDAVVDPTAAADLQALSRHGGAAVGRRRRHQLVVVRALQAPRHQHGQDRRLVRRRPRVQPGDQPAGRRDGRAHGPHPRDVRHRRAGRERHPAPHRRARSAPTPPRASSSPGRSRGPTPGRSPRARRSRCSPGPSPRPCCWRTAPWPRSTPSSPARAGARRPARRRRRRRRRSRPATSAPALSPPPGPDGHRRPATPAPTGGRVARRPPVHLTQAYARPDRPDLATMSRPSVAPLPGQAGVAGAPECLVYPCP